LGGGNLVAFTMFSFLESYHVYRLTSARDERSFAKIYDTHVESIYRFVYLKLSSKEQAEDVTAEVFLRFWQQVKRGEPIKHVRGLLYRIARNLIIDTYRQRGALPEMASVTFQEDDTSSLTDALSDRKIGQRAIEAKTDVALLLEQMKQLKEDYQDVLSLRLFQDLPFADIGEILGKDTGTVRVLYHRALKALERSQSLSSSHD
jgi:RNA polymerase sigma-70 factor (ECF subfamily)